MASRHGDSAQLVAQTVAGQLAPGHESTLQFCPLEDVIGSVAGHDDWKGQMRERYTDFTPIQDHLPRNSPLGRG